MPQCKFGVLDEDGTIWGPKFKKVVSYETQEKDWNFIYEYLQFWASMMIYVYRKLDVFQVDCNYKFSFYSCFLLGIFSLNGVKDYWQN